MTWEKEYKYVDEFEYVSLNQHGRRYKQTNSKQLCVAKLSAKTNDAADIQTLTLLSHTLNVPVHYDFEEQVAFIKVVSAEAI